MIADTLVASFSEPNTEAGVGPEGRGVAVVEIGDGDAEPVLEPRPHVVAGPVGVDEVGRSAAAQDARGARRPRCIEPRGDQFRERHAGPRCRQLEPRGDLPEADLRPLDAPGRVLAEPVDQELAPLVEKREVDGGATEVDAGDDFLRR